MASQSFWASCFDHGRQPYEVCDGRRGRVDVGHPGGMKRRALARIGEQRSESFGLITLDPLARPLQPSQVVLEGGAYRVHMCYAQLLVGQLRVMVGHTHSLPGMITDRMPNPVTPCGFVPTGLNDHGPCGG